jgi:hypothetical protein
VCAKQFNVYFQYAVDVGTLVPASNSINNKTGGLPAPRTRHYAVIADPAWAVRRGRAAALGYARCIVLAAGGSRP